MARRRVKEDRRGEIAKCAGALFAEQGVRATTVRDIAEGVGMLSGSLYHHFKTKNDIVHELMRQYGDDLVARYEQAAALGGTAIERLRRLFHACLEANLQNPDQEAILIRELDALFREPEFGYIHEMLVQIESLFVGVIQSGMESGEIRADIEVHFVYRMMMDVMGAVPRWYDPSQHAKDDVVEAWIDIFTRGVGRATTE